MTDRDRETLAMPWWQNLLKWLDNHPAPVVLKQKHCATGVLRWYCISHQMHTHHVRTLAKIGVLVLQSESPGVAVYVRAVPPEPKAAWLGGI